MPADARCHRALCERSSRLDKVALRITFADDERASVGCVLHRAAGKLEDACVVNIGEAAGIRVVSNGESIHIRCGCRLVDEREVKFTA